MVKLLNLIFLCLLVTAVCLALGACAVFNQPRIGEPVVALDDNPSRFFRWWETEASNL